jgi:5-methylcytosine-specific restriction endonuclease McrA
MSLFRWTGPNFKHEITPRAVTKAVRKRDEEAERKRIKKLVFARDGGKCRVCGKPATEMHELLFRSLMGERSLENSVAVCTFEANNCHSLLQTHAIAVEGEDANGRLVFRWAEHIKPEHRTFVIKSKRRSQNKDAA